MSRRQSLDTPPAFPAPRRRRGIVVPVTRDDLPAPNTGRWVVRRKAEVVAGVRMGLISLDEACRRYALTVEEFLAWQRLAEERGLLPGQRPAVA
jgi:hypothetical protein